MTTLPRCPGATACSATWPRRSVAQHSALDPKQATARLVRSGEAVWSVRNQCGLFQCGDSLGGDVLVVEIDDGPGGVRASTLVADSYRMLKRIVDGEPAQLDEGDDFTRSSAP